MKRIFLCFAVYLCLAGSFAQAAAAPDGSLRLLQEIAQHRGKVVLVNFFASWCEPCKQEIPSLVRIRRDYALDKVIVLGVSLDEEPALVPPFVQRLGINYPVQLATDDMPRMFRISAIPHNLVYDTTGRLVANQPGLIEENILRAAIDELLEQKK